VCVSCLGVVHTPVWSMRHTLPPFCVHRSSQHWEGEEEEAMGACNGIGNGDSCNGGGGSSDSCSRDSGGSACSNLQEQALGLRWMYSLVTIRK